MFAAFSPKSVCDIVAYPDGHIFRMSGVSLNDPSAIGTLYKLLAFQTHPIEFELSLTMGT
jgi:hypothetical protein